MQAGYKAASSAAHRNDGGRGGRGAERRRRVAARLREAGGHCRAPYLALPLRGADVLVGAAAGGLGQHQLGGLAHHLHHTRAGESMGRGGGRGVRCATRDKQARGGEACKGLAAWLQLRAAPVRSPWRSGALTCLVAACRTHTLGCREMVTVGPEQEAGTLAVGLKLRRAGEAGDAGNGGGEALRMHGAPGRTAGSRQAGQRGGRGLGACPPLGRAEGCLHRRQALVQVCSRADVGEVAQVVVHQKVAQVAGVLCARGQGGEEGGQTSGRGGWHRWESDAARVGEWMSGGFLFWLTKLAQAGPVEGGQGPVLGHQALPALAQHAGQERVQRTLRQRWRRQQKDGCC